MALAEILVPKLRSNGDGAPPFENNQTFHFLKMKQHKDEAHSACLFPQTVENTDKTKVICAELIMVDAALELPTSTNFKLVEKELQASTYGSNQPYN